MNNEIVEWTTEILEEENPEAIFFSGLDSALIGVGAVQHGEPVAVYSQELIIKHLIEDGMDEEDAWEYFSYNIQGAYLGEGTPFIIRTPSIGE
jgi:hypothetical protein